MATMYSTGPVLLWVGPQVIKPAAATPLPSGAPVFLGTAEQTPQAEIRRQYQPAYNDISGAVPFDLNFLGEDAILAIDLTRWDERVYARLAEAPVQLAGRTTPPPRGRVVAFTEMGSLQAHDGNSVTVYMVFPYGNPAIGGASPNAAGRAFGMPSGYRFHGGSLILDKLHQMGSKHLKLHLTFQFAPIYDYTTTILNLYDNTIPAGLFRPAA